MLGTTISHYKVLEKIGQGGLSEVYRAEDTNLSREVDIKVLGQRHCTSSKTGLRNSNVSLPRTKLKVGGKSCVGQEVDKKSHEF